LRRVKTWLYSTMSESRISGLYILSIHREKFKHNEDFIAQVIEKWTRQ